MLALEVDGLRLQQRLDTQSGAGQKEKDGLDNEFKQLEGQVRWQKSSLILFLKLNGLELNRKEEPYSTLPPPPKKPRFLSFRVFVIL